MSSTGAVCGTIGEFRSPEDAAGAVRRLKTSGFARWDVYGPAPLEQIIDLVPTRRGAYIVAIMIAGGLSGAVVAFFFQYWAQAVSYPINVGGRPLNGWPGFVPTSWEICALCTVAFGFFAFLLFCRLPQLHNPIFAVPEFERASQDRFFVCVESEDERYDHERIAWLLERCGALRVSEIRE